MRLEHLLSRDDLLHSVYRIDICYFYLLIIHNTTQSSTGDGVHHPSAGNYLSIVS